MCVCLSIICTAAAPNIGYTVERTEFSVDGRCSNGYAWISGRNIRVLREKNGEFFGIVHLQLIDMQDCGGYIFVGGHDIICSARQ